MTWHYNCFFKRISVLDKYPKVICVSEQKCLESKSKCSVEIDHLHVCERYDELIVGSDGHFVQVLIGPSQAEALPSQGRVNGDQLLSEVGQRSADIAIDHEAANLGIGSHLFEDGLEGDAFGHRDPRLSSSFPGNKVWSCW